GGSGGNRRDSADPQCRYSRRECLPTPMVLVFPQRFPVLQEWREYLFFFRRREPVSCDLRRRSELHCASLGYGRCAPRSGRKVSHCGTFGRTGVAGGGILCIAAAESGSRECFGGR